MILKGSSSMTRELKRHKAFALGLMLSLILALVPLATQGAANGLQPGGSPAVEQAAADREVIARVTLRNEEDQQHLSDAGAEILGTRIGYSVFIRASLSRAKLLENDGWTIEVLYLRDAGSTGSWEYIGQPNGSCTYDISPRARSFTYLQGSATFTLFTPEGCEWILITTAPWITVNGVHQGTGTTTFTYLVDENTAATRRTGEILVGGNTFRVLQGAKFTDVPTDNPFFLAIGKVSAHGITVGCGGSNFCPNAGVTRETMAAFLSRALGVFDPPTPAMQRYNDVPPENIFYNFIEEISVRGITVGCGSGNYCPVQLVTREQMAAFIIRALGEFNPPTPATQRFADVPPSNPFYNFIDRLAALGITVGCGGGNYCPSASVTRGQMASFLNTAFNLP
jgi:S-layer family protein